MKCIAVLGAGRSSGALINYLLSYAKSREFNVVVGDVSEAAARDRVGTHPSGDAVLFDVRNETQSSETISHADVVVSLLPANFHPTVAKLCLRHKKHLVTASYVSDEMRMLDPQARENSLILLNECGLDPGIDHMSAMHILDKLRAEGDKIVSFLSFTGGLIAPETDPQNPWRYKFTWNARNVVMAGQSTAKYLRNGQYKYIPYQQLFLRATPVFVPGLGELEGYANRDSLRYIGEYGLKDVKTMLRGTLRYNGFCSAWNILAQLGCCDDSYELANVESMTHTDFLNCFLDNIRSTSVKEEVMKRFDLKESGEEIKRLTWAGLFSDEKIGLKAGSPAAVLEHILNKRWTMKANDNDMVVMWHRFGVERDGKHRTIESFMIVKGMNSIDTAMARTVGLPLGIATRLIVEGKIQQRGVLIPTSKELYEPILKELASIGISLEEREVSS